jgi:hypothetical protein
MRSVGVIGTHIDEGVVVINGIDGIVGTNGANI